MKATLNENEIRKFFPITKKWNYLNHAVVSPLPLPVIQAMNKFNNERKMNGSMGYRDWFEQIEESKEEMSLLLNCQGKNLAFFQNTSHALNTVSNIIPFKKGDEIITTDLEFPSNTFPWLKLQDKGMKVRWLKSKNGSIDIESIKNGITEKTKVLAISHVCYYNGFRTDLKAVSEIAKDNNTILVVDATQSLGAMEINVKQIEVDFLAANSYKWLLGPFGTTLFYVKDPIDKFIPKDIGWYSVKDIWSRQIDSYDLVTDARRFEMGHPDFAGILGLQSSINLLLKFGLTAVEDKILEFTRKIRRFLSDYKKVQLISPEERISGITLFTIKDKSSEHVVNSLKDKGIIVFSQKWRDGVGVKISPHFYNSTEEIEAFFNEISKFL